MIKNLLCWVLLAFVVVSCDKSYVTPDPIARGLNFYPLEVGDYRIYDVTDTKYLLNDTTEREFQMREWVADSFMDQTNALTYKIIRSIRANAESEWENDSVMTVTKDQNMVMLMKDNTKYIKLVFPVKQGITWEADAFNDHIIKVDSTLGKYYREQYTYSAVDEPYTANNTVYAKSVLVTVLPPTETETTRFDDRKEVYARNIGRVYRLFKRLEFAPCNSDDCEGKEPEILDGHERHEVLVEHGKL